MKGNIIMSVADKTTQRGEKANRSYIKAYKAANRKLTAPNVVSHFCNL